MRGKEPQQPWGDCASWPFQQVMPQQDLDALYTADRVRRCAKSFSRNMASGADLLSIGVICGFPDEALAELAAIKLRVAAVVAICAIISSPF